MFLSKSCPVANPMDALCHPYGKAMNDQGITHVQTLNKAN